MKPCLALFATLAFLGTMSSQASDDETAPLVIHVATIGSDGAEGSKAAPVATVERAIALLPRGGTILLRAGVYRQAVKIEETPTDAPLTIQPEEDAEVIFDGGIPIAGWERQGDDGDFYVSTAAAPPMAFLWDRSRRVRFIRALDEAGARAWPGSFCVLKGGAIFLHPADGVAPGDSIERSELSRGFIVLRHQVTIKGIRFRNFFGNQYSAAISIGAVRDVEVSDCEIENASKGIAIMPLAERVSIVRCSIRDVHLGIANSGNAITIKECVLESASGAFAIHGLNSVLNCGIRLYHPGVGATVRDNVTAGFWVGLRIKTAVNDELRTASPFLIEHNTFTDGISLTPQVQQQFDQRDRFSANVYAANNDDAHVLETLRRDGVEMDGNYRYTPGHLAKTEKTEKAETADAIPFEDMPGGNLRLLPGITPSHDAAGTPIGASIVQVQWRPEVAALLAGNTEAERTPKRMQSLPAQRTPGVPLVIHVQAHADPAQANGTPEHPYPSLQTALDQVEPGDTVMLGEGVFTEAAVLNRGGTKEAPVTIKGAGPRATFLDGGRRLDTLLTLQGAGHVRIEGLHFRMFREAGIKVEKSPSVAIDDCCFINAEIASTEPASGMGIFMTGSPSARITRCITSRTKVGFKLVESPRAEIRNNTAFKNLNTALELVRSSRETEITYNSFGFSSHAAIYLWDQDSAAMKSLVCDYNNFAMRLYDYQKYNPTRTEAPKIETIAIAGRYGSVAGGKAVIDHLDSFIDNKPRIRYERLADWQKASGKDRHSLYIDPGYIDPLAGDFRLEKGSPNLLSKNKFIGAEPPADSNP